MLFEEVWQHFDTVYPSFSLKGVDWDDVGRRHRPRFERSLEPAEFGLALAAMLSELRDRHVNVQTPDGHWVPVYAPAFERNFTDQPRRRYITAEYARLGANAIWHTRLVGNIAYLRIDTLETAAYADVDSDALDALFAGYEGAAGWIVDVRPNAGGNEVIGQQIAGHFTDSERSYGHIQLRNGPARNDLGPPQRKLLVPSAGRRFLGPVMVLIGGRNMSSAEWFVLMMDACPNVTLIGERTRGSSGNPEWLELANGLRVSVPRWRALRPDGIPLEDHGIQPDVHIPSLQSFDGAHDYVVERALRELGVEL